MELKRNYAKLKAWQKAQDFATAIYKATNGFPKSELFGITSQIRRAAVSVPANIAEGRERQHDKEFIQFLHVARGSLAEVEVNLDLAVKLGYLDESEAIVLVDKASEVGKLINGLINSLKQG